MGNVMKTVDTHNDEPIPHWRFWLVTFGVFILLLWVLSPILLPFVIGLILAYFLDPIVDRLEDYGAKRWLASLFALVAFFFIFGLFLVLIMPLVQEQLGTLIEQVPVYVEKIRSGLIPWVQQTFGRLAPAEVKQLQSAAGSVAGNAVGVAGKAITTVFNSGMAIIDILSLVVITPVVAFYMLRDWDRMLAYVDKALPERHADTIRAEALKVHHTLAGFLRGQGLVCLSLGAYYAIALSLAGLDYGATIGLIVGVLSFIPYVGTITGFVCSMGLAFVQFNDPTSIMIVFIIYVAGQAIEGNFLAPKLVGDRVGLHPVWVIFALMAGGSLFGFVGVLVALPVAAVVGVLVRFMLNQYLQSRYYKAG